MSYYDPHNDPCPPDIWYREDDAGTEHAHRLTWRLSHYYPASLAGPEEPSEWELVSVDPDVDGETWEEIEQWGRENV